VKANNRQWRNGVARSNGVGEYGGSENNNENEAKALNNNEKMKKNEMAKMAGG
jgi:hypothetical protein